MFDDCGDTAPKYTASGSADHVSSITTFKRKVNTRNILQDQQLKVMLRPITKKDIYIKNSHTPNMPHQPTLPAPEESKVLGEEVSPLVCLEAVLDASLVCNNHVSQEKHAQLN